MGLCSTPGLGMRAWRNGGGSTVSLAGGLPTRVQLRTEPFHSDRERVEWLFALYEKLANPLLPAARGFKAPFFPRKG